MSKRNSKVFETASRPAEHDQTQPGQVKFDDRGNAVYEWSDPDLAIDGKVGDRLRSRALEHPGLSLMDETPANDTAVVNEKAARLGYNPYQSGLIQKGGRQQKKRTDLRALSKWIEAQRKNGKEET